MDELDEILISVRDFADESEPSPFDKILPEEPVLLPVESKRITYQTRARTTKIISLSKENKYHHLVFKACVAAFKSHWFNGLAEISKPAYFDWIRIYFDWINESGYTTTDKDRYSTLKKFESYCMNDRGNKKSPLEHINIVIKQGMGTSSKSNSDYEYLQTLLSLSKPEKRTEAELLSLSSWFDLPWLRKILGEHAYLQLESPRLLFLSFRVTIATTLLYLLKQRQYWQKFPVIKIDQSAKDWHYDWDRQLFLNVKVNTKSNPDDEFSQLLWLDLVKPSGQEALKEKLNRTGLKNLPINISYKNKKIYPWQKPIFFHPAFQTQYSYVEELLCAWLMACEAIQPSDIPKLKTNNFTLERNASGRLVAMECTYYKGRSGTYKQPALLMAKDTWTQAIDKYMTGLTVPALFKRKVGKAKVFPSLKTHEEVSFLLKIWKLPSFQKQLDMALKRSNATPLFLHSMLALEDGDECYSQFNTRTKQSVEKYRASIPRPLPSLLFSLTHIKNTAVHAGSDAYRSTDLINHHSHTSLTEKTSYLTDKNKEWVDQAGRITRLVLHDLQNVVYQPSITAISQSVHDMELRTRISDATNTNDLTIHSIQNRPIQHESDSTIIVSDTIDSALYFIHYIKQAEALLPKLLSARPDWVQRTLIVQVEWMTATLKRMRMTASAQKTYREMAVHLPQLFDHLLETTE